MTGVLFIDSSESRELFETLSIKDMGCPSIEIIG